MEKRTLTITINADWQGALRAAAQAGLTGHGPPGGNLELRNAFGIFWEADGSSLSHPACSAGRGGSARTRTGAATGARREARSPGRRRAGNPGPHRTYGTGWAAVSVRRHSRRYALAPGRVTCCPREFSGFEAPARAGLRGARRDRQPCSTTDPGSLGVCGGLRAGRRAQVTVI